MEVTWKVSHDIGLLVIWKINAFSRFGVFMPPLRNKLLSVNNFSWLPLAKGNEIFSFFLHLSVIYLPFFISNSFCFHLLIEGILFWPFHN